MKYTEHRTLNASSLRNTCCLYGFYTNGTNKEYLALFDRLEDSDGYGYAEMTTEKLVEIATDIYDHSDRNNAPNIPFVLYCLANACDTVFTEE